MIERTETYSDGATECRGFVAQPEGGAAPVVIVFPAWAGLDDFARDKARALARLGYLGFAADTYGGGRTGEGPQECSALMTPFMADRRMLRQRVRAAFEAARRVDGADGSRVAAIGFCFGGLCAFDLARSGVRGVAGVIGFHALFTPPDIGPQEPIHARVLALHGYDDPMGPPDALRGFCREMTAAGADWEVDAYGGTVHAFTNPQANDPSMGIVYRRRADERSHDRMRDFLRECFAGG